MGRAGPGCGPGSRLSKCKGPEAAHTWFPSGHKGGSCVCSLTVCDLSKQETDSHSHAVRDLKTPCRLKPPCPLPHLMSTADLPCLARPAFGLLLRDAHRPSPHVLSSPCLECPLCLPSHNCLSPRTPPPHHMDWAGAKSPLSSFYRRAHAHTHMHTCAHAHTHTHMHAHWPAGGRGTCWLPSEWPDI